jgi:hypothetical protein
MIVEALPILFYPIFHVGTINQAITVPTMLLTLAGAIVLLFIVNLFRRGRRHSR